MKKLSTFVLISSLLINSSIANAANFSDVSTDYIYYNSINELVGQGCIKGYEDNTFKPDNSINRAEALKVILTCLELPSIYTEQKLPLTKGTKITLEGVETIISQDTEVTIKTPFDPVQYSDLDFKDITNEEWFIPQLKEAIVRKLITGYNDNTIRPLQTVSKAELYTILYRLTPQALQEVDAEDALADDIASGYWFYEPLQFALENKLLTTNADNLISPHKELTRAQVVHFVNEYSKWLNERIVKDEDSAEENENSSEEENTTDEQSEQESSSDETETEENSTEDETENTTEEESNSETDSSSSQNEENSDSEVKIGFTEEGVASYYGYSFDGRRTASGELLDTASFMAAHKTLPFGTIARITNESGFYVEVRIVDRGPYVDGRIVDLTPAAFEALDPLSKGVTKVTLEVISLP